MKRDASEVIAAIVARMRDEGDVQIFGWPRAIQQWADELEATLPAAEPAEAGRDAVAHRLELAAMLGEMLRHDADETHPRIKALEYFARPPSEAVAATCAWAQEDEEGGCWVTGCGHLFELNNGGPSDNGMRHCCYCGKPLTEHPWRDEDEDAIASQQAVKP